MRDLELGLGLLQLRLELALVEREQQLVLLDDRALGEVLRFEEGLHAGADLHRFPGIGLGHELAVDRHRLLDDSVTTTAGGGGAAAAGLALSASLPRSQAASEAAGARHRAPSRRPATGSSGIVAALPSHSPYGGIRERTFDPGRHDGPLLTQSSGSAAPGPRRRPKWGDAIERRAEDAARDVGYGCTRRRSMTPGSPALEGP